MKCPKCGYLGFEPVDRCRNCGYEFSLSGSVPTPELSLKTSLSEREAPLVDLALVDAAMAASEAAPSSDVYAATAHRGDPPVELPLFGGPGDDAPMIRRPSAPRTPLSVRRATPEVPRLRSETRQAASMDLPLLGLEAPAPLSVAAPIAPRIAAADRTHTPPPVAVDAVPARAGSRVIAALIDFTILGAIDLLVVYLTMKICGLTNAELAMLPKAPLGAFLLAQNLSYFIAFTAGGQTLGKMSTGIRVVAAEGDAAPDLAHAFKRTLVWAILALPAGLGFLSALLSADQRGLHDRMAETRVIRVTA